MKKINPKSQPGLAALKKKAPGVVRDMGYFKNGGSGMPMSSLSRQESKLLMRDGAAIDEMMFGSLTEKMRKGGNAQRIARNAETGKETRQKYNLGGGTHNTYSGK